MTTYDNRDHFNLAVPFKVVNDTTFNVIGSFASLRAAERFAQEQRAEKGHHYRIFEVKWLTSTKTLADLDREQRI